MEYERIHKPQTGLISPSKLRMKLMGHQRKKDGSNSNSSRTSPSKLEDSEFVNNSLLASSVDFDEPVSSVGSASVNHSSSLVSNNTQGDQSALHPKEFTSGDPGNSIRVKMQQFSKADSANSSSVHPMRTLEDDLDYDSNASSSSFEFPEGDRIVNNPIGRSLLRPMSSKWNDAEKWIMNKQNGPVNHTKKNTVQSQVTRVPVMNGIRVVPESANYNHKSLVKRVNLFQSAQQVSLDNFFTSNGSQPVSGQENGTSVPLDLCHQSKDLKEVDSENSSCVTTSFEESKGPNIRSVSMRDMGTEMTPIPSQEPSRTATPVGATTPLRSPISSLPSTPRGGPTSTSEEYLNNDCELRSSAGNGAKALSAQELKLKTRKEIVALGVQLGKMNIAAWASKDEKDKNASEAENTKSEELRKIEYEKRAAAWEEAVKAKQTARFSLYYNYALKFVKFEF
uniref:Remorin C-terminal domain-containing protein n=1 Tax=Daucus carota subsp. sativus TaxID=79200 RepID=A0A166IKP6_DAUCS